MYNRAMTLFKPTKPANTQSLFIPDDVVKYIMSFLGLEDIVRYSRTCKQTQSVADNLTWRLKPVLKPDDFSNALSKQILGSDLKKTLNDLYAKKIKTNKRSQWLEWFQDIETNVWRNRDCYIYAPWIVIGEVCALLLCIKFFVDTVDEHYMYRHDPKHSLILLAATACLLLVLSLLVLGAAMLVDAGYDYFNLHFKSMRISSEAWRQACHARDAFDKTYKAYEPIFECLEPLKNFKR